MLGFSQSTCPKQCSTHLSHNRNLCCSVKDWHSATQVARAFNIGKSEATAISNLQDKISPKLVDLLKEATRCRGMRQFLTHDVLSKDMFNTGYSSGQSGALIAWCVDLSNNRDDVLEAR